MTLTLRQLTFIIFDMRTLQKNAKRRCIDNSPNAFCVAALPCKILINFGHVHCYISTY